MKKSLLGTTALPLVFFACTSVQAGTPLSPNSINMHTNVLKILGFKTTKYPESHVVASGDIERVTPKGVKNNQDEETTTPSNVVSSADANVAESNKVPVK